MTACPYKIRPFPNDTELQCGKDEHLRLDQQDTEPGQTPEHAATLRDYAHPGSVTEVTWLAGDRREFTGDWPGYCRALGHYRDSTLPAGHKGRCAH
jgi:hypothetical protein